jgi:uncharacterized lipoprotein YmbA
MRSAPVLISLLLLSACGSSPPTRFFTLDPVGEPLQGAMRSSHPVAVGDVSIPPMLDRAAFVTREGANRIDVSDQNRWAAPLETMIRRVLADDLSRALPPRAVIAPGEPVPPDARTVVVSIRDFIGDSSGRVRLEADWTLTAGKPPKPEMTRHEIIVEQAASGDPGAIAAAMSRALGALSQRIARTLQDLS